MSNDPPRILDYAGPRPPSGNVVPSADNPKASIPLVVGALFGPVGALLGYWLAFWAYTFLKHWLPGAWAATAALVAAASCLSWPLVYAFTQGLRARAEVRRGVLHDHGQIVVGLLLCAAWAVALVVLLVWAVVEVFRD